MFGKNKKLPFGKNIRPSCAYCKYGVDQGEKRLCSLHKEMKNGNCKKFSYDPLLREPHTAPTLSTDGFTSEDFKL